MKFFICLAMCSVLMSGCVKRTNNPTHPDYWEPRGKFSDIVDCAEASKETYVSPDGKDTIKNSNIHKYYRCMDKRGYTRR